MMKHRILIPAFLFFTVAVTSCKKNSPAPRTTPNGNGFVMSVNLTNRTGYITRTTPLNITISIVDNYVLVTNKAYAWTDLDTYEDFSHTEMLRDTFSVVTYGLNNTVFNNTVPTDLLTYNPSPVRKDTVIRDSIYSATLVQKTVVFTKNYTSDLAEENEVTRLISSLTFSKDNVDYINYTFGLEIPNNAVNPYYASYPVLYQLK